MQDYSPFGQIRAAEFAASSDSVSFGAEARKVRVMETEPKQTPPLLDAWAKAATDDLMRRVAALVAFERGMVIRRLK